MMKHWTLFCISLLMVGLAIAQKALPIVPYPNNIILGTQQKQLNTQIHFKLSNDSLQTEADYFSNYLTQYRYPVIVGDKSNLSTQIELKIDPAMDQPEAYQFKVNESGITIKAGAKAGIFYGLQTLIQCLPSQPTANIAIPFLTIEDQPRFGYRGLHLDVSRHFFSIEEVKHLISWMALHKLNRFHWHLTDDQGWRIEIKKYPLLTTMGSQRSGTIIGRYPGTGNTGKPHGGFYTQAEIKDVVAFAQQLHITVVPEIEMPGHASAALSAYPHLGCTGGPYQVQQTWGVFDEVFCAGNDATFSFLQDVLAEVIPLFPGQLIHIGGDECPKTSWKKCPKCQARKKEMGLKDEHELQSYFVQRIERYINSQGKTMIGWDEILEGGLAPNAVVMSWRGEKGGIEAAKQNHPVIMTPGNYVYLDHSQTKQEDSVTIGSYTPLEEIYGYNPIPKELAGDKAHLVWGAQGNVWTEYMTNFAKVQYMVFPRLAALSEVLWTSPSAKSWQRFEAGIPTLFERYKLWNINYSKAYFGISTNVKPIQNKPGQLSLTVTTKAPNAKLTVKPANSTNAFNYTKPITINKSENYAISGSYQDSPLGSPINLSFQFNKATANPIQLSPTPSEKYPGENGKEGLANGLISNKGINSTEWLGWEGETVTAIVDLGKTQRIQNFGVHALESRGSWIYSPDQVSIAVSTDGQNFKEVAQLKSATQLNNKEGWIQMATPQQQARFIRFTIQAQQQIPAGFPGEGHKAWLFVDELSVQ